jgi:hypothetical protein
MRSSETPRPELCGLEVRAGGRLLLVEGREDVAEQEVVIGILRIGVDRLPDDGQGLLVPTQRHEGLGEAVQRDGVDGIAKDDVLVDLRGGLELAQVGVEVGEEALGLAAAGIGVDGLLDAVDGLAQEAHRAL